MPRVSHHHCYHRKNTFPRAVSGCQHPEPPTSGVFRTTIIMLTSDFRTDNRQPRIQTTKLSACLVQTGALGGEGEAVETSPRTGRRVTAMMRRKRHTPPQCTYRSRGLAGQRSGLQAQSTRLEEKRRGKRMERESKLAGSAACIIDHCQNTCHEPLL